jgi:5,10-methylenetetrahydrofolate reductase
MHLRAGVTSRLTPVPEWKRQASFLFVQACFEMDALLRWRDDVDIDGKVFAGVLVPPSSSRARKWTAEIPEISVPDSWISALDKDPSSGVELACELVSAIGESGAFHGVHLIPGVRYRDIAFRLESDFG